MSYILIVEDEALLGFMMKADINAVSTMPVEICTSSERAFAVVTNRVPHLAFLDINLGNETSFGIAEWLIDRQIPTFFVTSYSSESLKKMKIPTVLSSVRVIAKSGFRKEIGAILADTGSGCTL